MGSMPQDTTRIGNTRRSTYRERANLKTIEDAQVNGAIIKPDGKNMTVRFTTHLNQFFSSSNKPVKKEETDLLSNHLSSMT